MKLFMAYWIAGCLIIGMGAMHRAIRCPNETLASDQAAIYAVAIWPAGFAAYAVSDRPTIDRVLACENHDHQ